MSFAAYASETNNNNNNNNNSNNNNNFKTYKAQISISIYLNAPNPCYDQLTAVKKGIR